MCESWIQNWMYLSFLSTEDSGRGSSIPPSHGSILGSHTVSDHLPAQEGGLESPLTKESSGILPTPTSDRRGSRASLEESVHSASSGEGHPLLSSGEGQEHPLLSLSLSQLQKPPPPTQDSSSVVFRNGFTPLHCAIRVSVGEARGLCLPCPALPSRPCPSPYRMATSPRSPRRLRAGLTWSSPPPPPRPSGLWSSPSTMTIFK